MADERNVASEAGPRGLGPAVPGRDVSAADRIRSAEFPIAMRGYEREVVEAFVAETADLIQALESRQTRESVVQRALEEVGEQTSAILKQAHESGDDITARSRSQAEDRLQRAREEAAAIIAAAEARAAELEQATAVLRDERAGLLDDLRRLAAETLAVAGEAEEEVEAPISGPVSGALEAADPPYDASEDVSVEPLDDWPDEGVEEQDTAELQAAPDAGSPGDAPRGAGRRPEP